MLQSPGPSRPILFVENREKTQFWSEVAKRLIGQGLDIHWLVQNHAFGRDLPGTTHFLPYPDKGSGQTGHDDLERFPILITDRGRQYFGAGTAHYSDYADAISAVFDKVGPGLVVGESTLFHELLAVSIAEARNIPFIHPAGERYPQARFVMFRGISQEAYIGSGDVLEADEALAYAGRVRDGTERPIYMTRPTGLGRAIRQVRWAATRIKIWLAYLAGEKFNTPSMRRKWQLSRHSARNIDAWRLLERNVPAGRRAIMYPMHVAPEANIDVWGRPFEDQFALITRLLAAAPDDTLIAVKANPYPKYEITDELIALARNDDRVCLLPMTMGMAEAMTQCKGAITVSGTVGFEAVFGKGRCLSLRHPIIEQACPQFAAESPESAVQRLLDDSMAGSGNPEASAALLQAITARSFNGFITDPFSNSACLEPANLELVAHGIAVAFGQAQSHPEHR